MPLLSRMIRQSAIYGEPTAVSSWMTNRQGDRWAQQWIQGVYPAMTHERQHRLDDLRTRGVVTEEEYARLREGVHKAPRSD